ncbi:MAG: S8 family serine peptidase [Bacteroidia bacterium]|nr:S8 family serine peptidase [Bacteroidia bacterium]
MLKLLYLLPLILSVECFAQTKYWVQFTDKNNTPYTVTNPAAFLSSRSIQRRANQGIPVTVQDLPVDPNYIQQVLNAGAVTLINRSKWFNAITIQTSDANALTAIQGFSFVVNVQPVQRYVLNNDIEEQSISPVDFTQRIDFTEEPTAFNYGTSYTQVNQIGMVCMHNQGWTGNNMVIAVLDAGFLNADTLRIFDSLFLQNRILGTWDFVSNNASVYEDNGHGTMVLSCMGANWPGVMIGTAPHAKYWLLRTEEAATEYVIEEDNWVSGAEFADSVGADVLNTSLGYTVFDNSSQNHTYQDMDGNTTRITIATDIAVSKGMFAVNSAGNSGNNSWNFIGAPADADSVLAVGAVDGSGAYVNFSSNGPTYDGRVKPNVAAMGSGVVVANPSGGITTSGGTSFASPLTAGSVAALWGAHPTYNVMTIFNAIQTTASQFANPDTLLGYGIANFCNANLTVGSTGPSPFNNSMILQLFPNPTSGEFYFDFYSAETQDIIVSLTDVAGRELLLDGRHVQNNSTTRFMVREVPSFNSGVYILKLTTRSGQIVRRIVKK